MRCRDRQALRLGQELFRQNQGPHLQGNRTLQQALSSAQGNVGTLVNLYTTASNYAVTNLGLNEFSYLASSVLATGITSVDMTTLQGTMQQGDKFAEFYLDKTNVYETVLNVYYHEVGSEE